MNNTSAVIPTKGLDATKFARICVLIGDDAAAKAPGADERDYVDAMTSLLQDGFVLPSSVERGVKADLLLASYHHFAENPALLEEALNKRWPSVPK